jgi:anti-sigma factor ChrR (cupin superfamily)
VAVLEWEKLREGIAIKHLARDPEKNLQVDLLKISPGFNDVVHYHDDYEWVYILEGSLEDERGKHTKGDFLINPKDAAHKPSSKEGCLLLLVWCGSVRHEA